MSFDDYVNFVGDDIIVGDSEDTNELRAKLKSDKEKDILVEL